MSNDWGDAGEPAPVVCVPTETHANIRASDASCHEQFEYL